MLRTTKKGNKIIKTTKESYRKSRFFFNINKRRKKSDCRNERLFSTEKNNHCW